MDFTDHLKLDCIMGTELRLVKTSIDFKTLLQIYITDW